MITQPTDTMPLPTRPANGFRRPALMAALALSEHLVAAQVPAPDGIRIGSPISAGAEATVECYLYHDLAALGLWQAAFGGEITHKLYGDRQVYSELAGRAYGAPFTAWTLRAITPEQQVAERQMTARWIDEHGPFDDWSQETHTTYRDLILRYRLEAAR